jgi:hypothetical protein
MDIEDLINNVANQDFANAGPTFAEIMRSKMDDALEQEKVAVAGQIFNGVEDVEPDEEDIEAAIDELEDEDDEDQLEMDFDEDEDEDEE